MKKNFEQKYHEVEQRHFWFKARRNYILQLLKNEDRSSTILDIGCSSGWLLKDLEQAGFEKKNLYGIDISQKAIINCKQKGLDNCYEMSAESIQIKQKFDIIIASDCLEHIEHDQSTLKHWHEKLNSNGKIFVFVPAFMSLWSPHDEVNLHYRRYRKNQLTTLLKNSNFNIISSGYWNFFLFGPLFVYRFFSNKFSSHKNSTTSGDLNDLGSFNPILLWLLNTENKLLKFITFPFGISTYVIAKK
ncbi:class I SAM-dependent methyltransferase [Winogradskyella ursingii]|uniref:class I SAM-dependent methyltransferase n=1 Tax=Winogradskyella ursingii TaxID=2686079 RepID=UPI0015CD4261|nr:class I SAM-dependent methyltransferase [Winogradskyella ursingii]